MPWVRIDENAMDHPKVAGLPDGAFRLWVEGLSYCQRYLTDGRIFARGVKTLRHYSLNRMRALIDGGLWERSDDGITVHDYLTWNDSREQVLFARESAKRRVSLLRDPELRQAVKDRDGDACRYCARLVRWSDRKGDLGGTYDHVDPALGNTLDNLVVCCRGCNSGKGRRTPTQARMSLLPAPIQIGSRSDLDQIKCATRGVVCSEEKEPNSQEREGGSGETMMAADPIAVRRFVDKHQELHLHYRGVPYIGNARKDYEAACLLVGAFPDVAMQDNLLIYGLNDSDPWMEKGPRTIPKIASQASKYAEELKAKKLA